MKVELRGIVQFWDKGRKKTRLVFRDDKTPGRRVVNLADNARIDEDLVKNELGSFTKSPLGNILIPRHIRVEDIEDKDKK